MKVTKKLAADLVDIGRTTFYRHIKEKGISIDPDGRIDFSELLRVYGNENVKTPEQLKEEKAGKSKNEDRPGIEASLKAEVDRLKEELSKTTSERQRERDQLTEEITTLRNSLNKSMDQNTNLTRLLTDQREKALTEKSEEEKSKDKKLEEMMERIKQIQDSQKNQGLFARLFSRKSVS